ncbi:ganglioside GM2 activator-like isoform X2 [Mya arenaria]|uniref:ganglioside GM2 activator-like isoform X3 n=1 Tax=Mya arenaria TaxID=6604 RepID=UPI0022E34ABE|nr:ganglioside GM2 activator-like isoform X3 [Mya arenaria]XP_052794619.1 ganglioside GM2 activator-like isoform X2 [Mya arenaria]
MDIMAVLYFCVLGFLMMYVDADFVNLMEIDRGLDVETPHEPYKWHSFQDSQFLWSLCNKTAVPVVVTSLHIEPDPIQFGHNISFSGQIDVFEDVGTTKTLEAHLKVMMKLDTQWFDVCVYKPEYCNINDVCDTMKLVVSDKCPPFLKRFCQCPFKKGNYPIPTLTKMVPNPPITVSGRFDITMTLTESQKEIGCLNVQLCLGQC